MIVRVTDPARRHGLDAHGLVWVDGVAYLDGPPDAVADLVAALRARNNRAAERAIGDPLVHFPGALAFDEVTAVPDTWTAAAAATPS